MITSTLLTIGAGLLQWVLGFFNFDLAPWVSQVDVNVGTVLGYLAGMGVWVDWVAVTTVLGGVLTVWAGCFTVKLILRIVSHVPEIGGNW